MSYYSLEEKVRNFAVSSRCLLLLIQFISNLVIPDHEADAFVSPSDPELTQGFGDTLVTYLLGGLIRWDSQYFIHIAEYGYTHENTLAFFPLYPLTLRFLSKLTFIPLQLVCNYHSTIIITAVALNFILFVKTATIFYQLSREVLKHEVLAYRASILFCINPASVFFSAPYSEAIFSFFTFSALVNYELGGGWAAPAQFGLAGAGRSNGIVNIGFVLYHKLQHCSNYYYKLRNARNSSSDFMSRVLVVILTFNYTLVPLFIASCSVLTPFAIYQAWCYVTYCGDEASSSLPPHLESFVRNNFLHSPDLGEAEWCYDVLPLAYRHVQDKYWEVGLFRYYELKQLPNFLLAVPIVLMIICHAALYFVDNPQVVWSLGIPHPDQIESPASLKKIDDDPGSTKSRRVWCSRGIYSWKVFVYTLHGLAVCFFCLIFVNVQVTTRLVCSSCPVAYWFAAHLVTNFNSSLPADSSINKNSLNGYGKPETIENRNKYFAISFLSSLPTGFWGQIIISYFVIYFFLGTILFSNFLPWT